MVFKLYFKNTLCTEVSVFLAARSVTVSQYPYLHDVSVIPSWLVSFGGKLCMALPSSKIMKCLYNIWFLFL
jgi:hypothetical protein